MGPSFVGRQEKKRTASVWMEQSYRTKGVSVYSTLFSGSSFIFNISLGLIQELFVQNEN